MKKDKSLKHFIIFINSYNDFDNILPFIDYVLLNKKAKVTLYKTNDSDLNGCKDHLYYLEHAYNLIPSYYDENFSKYYNFSVILYRKYRNFARRAKHSSMLIPTLFILPWFKTFFYDFCKGTDFDIDNTPSQVGYFSTYILNNNESIRTSHPIFSVAMIGRSAKELCENISTDAFGKESIFDKLYNLSRSKILFFNSNFDTCTFIHYVEQKQNITYRYLKQFKGNVVNKGKNHITTCTYFVRPLDGTINTNMGKLELHMKEKHILNTIGLYNGIVQCMDVNKFVNETLRLLDKDKYWLINLNK